MAVNIHITIIELNALHTKRQNLFQELDAVIHLLMEEILSFRMQGVEFDNGDMYRSEERFSRNAETDLVCRLLLEKKNYERAEVARRLLAELDLLGAAEQANPEDARDIEPEDSDTQPAQHPDPVAL